MDEIIIDLLIIFFRRFACDTTFHRHNIITVLFHRNPRKLLIKTEMNRYIVNAHLHNVHFKDGKHF